MPLGLGREATSLIGRVMIDHCVAGLALELPDSYPALSGCNHLQHGSGPAVAGNS